MPQCCADGCFSQQGTGKMLHRLPTDSVRRAEWVRRIGRKSWTPNNNCRLCEDHFTPDQNEQNRIDGLRKLKCNAVPSIFKYRCEESQNRDSLIGNMRSDTPCMDNGPSSTNNDPSTESHIIPDASSSTNNDPSTESHIIPDASSSTNNDPSTESHIIPDAPCSVDFSRPKLPRPIPEHSIDIEKQELLGKIQLLRKKNYKLKAKIKQLKSSFYTKKQELLQKVKLLYKKMRNVEAKRQKIESLIQKLEAERNRLESVTTLLFNDDQRRYLTRGNTRGIPWSKATIETGLKLRNACGIKGYSFLRDIGFPIPCERTLQQKIENMKMQPGILDFADVLQTKISLMNDHERESVLMIDEMALSPSFAFDQSSGIVMGRPSIPNAKDLPDFTYGSSLCDENVSPNQFIENNVSPENSFSRNTTDVSTSIYMDLESIGSVLSEEEGQSLYKLSGAVVRTVINRHRIRCETCKSALLKSTSCDISRVQVLTDLSNYSRPDTFDKNSGLIFCSELVYCFLQNAEFIFRKREEEILSGVVTFSEMLETLLPLCITYKFPPCHSVGKHILKAYLFSRIHFIVRKFNNTIVCNKSSKCGSKSVGMRNAVNK